jgi:hypothetical protein
LGIFSSGIFVASLLTLSLSILQVWSCDPSALQVCCGGCGVPREDAAERMKLKSAANYHLRFSQVDIHQINKDSLVEKYRS